MVKKEKEPGSKAVDYIAIEVRKQPAGNGGCLVISFLHRESTA